MEFNRESAVAKSPDIIECGFVGKMFGWDSCTEEFIHDSCRPAPDDYFVETFSVPDFCICRWKELQLLLRNMGEDEIVFGKGFQEKSFSGDHLLQRSRRRCEMFGVFSESYIIPRVIYPEFLQLGGVSGS